MTDIQVINFERHGLKYWRKHSSYHFAAGNALCPLAIQELPKAVLSLPIGLVPKGDGFIPVAIQGLKDGENLFVAHDGRWLTNYIPATYRGYPFSMASTESGEQVLCVDETSGLVVDDGGEVFFKEDGTPGQAVTEIFRFFSELEASRSVTEKICDVLHKHDLIQPWAITVRNGEAEENVDGLFRIDEAKLGELSADALKELRDSGGLTLIYCQLLSVQHLPSLGLLAQGHADAEAARLAKEQSTGELHLGFINGGGTFNFGD